MRGAIQACEAIAPVYKWAVQTRSVRSLRREVLPAGRPLSDALNTLRKVMDETRAFMHLSAISILEFGEIMISCHRSVLREAEVVSSQ